MKGYSLDECGLVGCITGGEVCQQEGAEIPIEKSKALLEKIQKTIIHKREEENKSKYQKNDNIIETTTNLTKKIF